MTLAYRNASVADAAELASLFTSVFEDTFGHLYDPADYRAFMNQHSVDHWREQLGDPEYAVHLADEDGRPAGYAKLGPSELPVDRRGPASELRQLYVLKDWHGRGVAPALMDWTIAEARRRGSAELYLTVFTENHRARRFYERYGFEEVGPYKFMVGAQADEDIIMRLPL